MTSVALSPGWLPSSAAASARRRVTTQPPANPVGILRGLHRCRDGGSQSLLGYAPDFADERAAEVVQTCRALAVDLPVDDLADDLTGWEPLLGHGWATR